MKSLLKIAITGLMLLTIAGSVAMATGGVASAALDPGAGGGGGGSGGTTSDQPTSDTTKKSNLDDPNCVSNSSAGVKACLSNNKFLKDLNQIVDFLSAAVGIIVIGMIILGGIQYSLAGGSSEATGKAKTRITNGLIALAAFLFTFAFLQWIIPGGL